MDPAIAMLLLCFTLQSGSDEEPARDPAEGDRNQPAPRTACSQVTVRTVEGAKLVSLSVQDADLRKILECLARIGNVSIVLDEHVKGKVTAELSDVPWRQALCAILDSHGLAIEINGLPSCPPGSSDLSRRNNVDAQTSTRLNQNREEGSETENP
jgi:type II secretory pathway component HofQ